MYPQPYDSVIFTQQAPHTVAQTFIGQLSLRWPNRVISLTHPIINPRIDKTLRAGETPKLPRQECFLQIDRDSTMHAAWDWGVTNCAEFGGEGPIQLIYSLIKPVDLSITVEHENLPGSDGFAPHDPYPAYFWGNLTQFTLATPQDPARPGFSQDILQLLRAILLG